MSQLRADEPLTPVPNRLENVKASEWLSLKGEGTVGSIADHLMHRKDLTSEPVEPNRALSLEDLALLLRLSEVLIDRQIDLQTRKNAAVALGNLRHHHSISPLMAVFRDETQPDELRAKCAESLSFILDQRIVGYLVHEGLMAESDRVVSATNASLARLIVAPEAPKWPELPVGQIRHQEVSDAEVQRHVLRWQEWWRKNQRRIQLGENPLGSY